jgi:integrase
LVSGALAAGGRACQCRPARSLHPPYGVLVRFAAYTGLRPCEFVALKVGRLDLLRATVRVAEAAPEVAGHLEWGGVKTHEARTVRLPRELGAYLADRPHGRDDLVFTATRGGPLRSSKFVPVHFKPAIGAANEAIAQLDADSRPDPLPEALRLYDLRHTAASLMIRQGPASRRCRSSSATPRPASPWTPTGTCSPMSWTHWLAAWRMPAPTL